MNRDTILETLSRHRDDLKECGVSSIAIFGSVARGEVRPWIW